MTQENRIYDETIMGHNNYFMVLEEDQTFMYIYKPMQLKRMHAASS